MAVVKRIVNGFLTTIRGADGKLSARRITAFWFVVLATMIVTCELAIIWLAVFKQITLTSYTIELLGVGVDILWVVCGMILMLFGVVTWDKIQHLKAGKEKKEDV